jgi:hypothetical protein
LALLRESVPVELAVPVSYSVLLKKTGLADNELSNMLQFLEKERYINTWHIGTDTFKIQLTEKGLIAELDAEEL